MSSAKSELLPDFEHSIKALEALVERLERGDLPLEEALKEFEQGIALTRACQAALKQAEQKVQILLKASSDDEPAVVEDFKPES